MKQYLFVLGRTPKLSAAELKSFVSSITHLRTDILLASTDIQPNEFINKLGGTIKICEVVYVGDLPTKEVFETILIDQVKENALTFGISTYGESTPCSTKTLFAVKETFVARGVRTRFIESKHDAPLSSVVIHKQKVTELVCIESEGDWYIGVTNAIQDFEQWNQRDFGRPYSDPKHGMLPPKVARMITNIAKGALGMDTFTRESPVLLDPFCGTGTILTEALTMGWRVVGADISNVAVERTRKNISWARARFALLPQEFKVFVHDATHISEVIDIPIHAIVTEPYMGNTNASHYGRVIDREKAKNSIKGLEKLYIGCLREWSKIVVKSGVIVIALPQYVIGRESLFVKKVIDRCESLGYTLLDGPIEYGRPEAVVRREFYIFRKN